MIAILIALSSPAADFDRCVKALTGRKSLAVKVGVITTGQGPKLTTKSVLIMRGRNWVSVDVELPEAPNHGPLKWTCESHDAVLRAYDPARNAYIEQRFAQALPPGAALNAQFGQMIVDPVQRLMSPDKLKQFFNSFVRLSGWVKIAKAHQRVWYYKQGASTMKFAFDSVTGLLSDWTITTNGTTEWTFDYVDPNSIAPLVVPKDAQRLGSFRLPPVQPDITDSALRPLIAKCFASYERLFNFTADVVVDGVKYKLIRHGESVSEVGPNGGWEWSGGQLAVWHDGDRCYRGSTTLSRARTYLYQLGATAEPLALASLSDENYAASLFTKYYEARKVGNLTLHNVPLNLLQLTGPAVKIDVALDDAGLIRRIDSSAYDSHGRLMAETLRQLDYGAAAPLAAVPTKSVPLPKLRPQPKLEVK